MEGFNVEIVSKPAYKAVGMKWQGTFTEAAQGEIRAVIKQMKDRLNEIKYMDNPDILLGLSYHDIPGGFTHYSVVEVSKVDEIPEGMLSITIPSWTYVRSEHKQGNRIDETYGNIYSWMERNGYRPYKDPNIVYYDSLPIKHEEYPLDKVLGKEPQFTIMIPVVTDVQIEKNKS